MAKRAARAEKRARQAALLAVKTAHVAVVPRCLACQVRNDIVRDAVRLCHQCNLPYCLSCYRLSHRKGRPQFHTWTKYEQRLDSYHQEETRKAESHDAALNAHLARTNPRQYARRIAVAEFHWSDALVRQAGQLWLDADWERRGTLDLGQVMELLRTLLKKRADEVTSVRTALRHAWKKMDYQTTIGFEELIAIGPVFDAYFKHDALARVGKGGKAADNLGFDPSIFL